MNALINLEEDITPVKELTVDEAFELGTDMSNLEQDIDTLNRDYGRFDRGISTLATLEDSDSTAYAIALSAIASDMGITVDTLNTEISFKAIKDTIVVLLNVARVYITKMVATAKKFFLKAMAWIVTSDKRVEAVKKYYSDNKDKDFLSTATTEAKELFTGKILIAKAIEEVLAKHDVVISDDLDRMGDIMAKIGFGNNIKIVVGENDVKKSTELFNSSDLLEDYVFRDEVHGAEDSFYNAFAVSTRRDIITFIVVVTDGKGDTEVYEVDRTVSTKGIKNEVKELKGETILEYLDNLYSSKDFQEYTDYAFDQMQKTTNAIEDIKTYAEENLSLKHDANMSDDEHAEKNKEQIEENDKKLMEYVKNYKEFAIGLSKSTYANVRGEITKYRGTLKLAESLQKSAK